MEDTITTDTVADTADSDFGFTEWSDDAEPEATEATEDQGVEQFQDEADGEATDEDDGTDEGEEAEDDTVELKVNGETMTKTVDEVIALAQKQIAAEVKFEKLKEAANELNAEKMKIEQTRSSLKQFVAQMNSRDPLDHIQLYDQLRKHIPTMPSFQDMVEAFVTRELEWQSMPEHERQLKAVEHERKKIEAERNAILEEQKRQKFETSRAEFLNYLNSSLPAALQSVGLDNTPATLRRVAATWMELENRNNQLPAERRVTLDAQSVAAFVKKQVDQEKFDNLETLSEDELLRRLPESVRMKLVKATKEKVTSKFKKKAPTTGAPAPKPPSKPGSYVNASEFFKSW